MQSTESSSALAMGEEIITDDEVAMHKRPVVYVSNLPYEARVEDLEGVFEQEGISVVRDKTVATIVDHETHTPPCME